MAPLPHKRLLDAWMSAKMPVTIICADRLWLAGKLEEMLDPSGSAVPGRYLLDCSLPNVVTRYGFAFYDTEVVSVDKEQRWIFLKKL